VREDFQGYFTSALVIPISHNAEDIRSYLEMRLSRNPKPDAMGDGLRAENVGIILERLSDMWVALFNICSLSMNITHDCVQIPPCFSKH